MSESTPSDAERRSATVTIADVAREAGVSKTSVSRYLSGEFSVLSDGKLEQIQSAITRLDYHPNQLARGLKRGRTRLIGFVVADVMNPYSVAVLHGAETTCQKYGFTLMLCNTGGSIERERRELAVLASYRVEGIILNPVSQPPGDLEKIVPKSVKLVLLDRRQPGSPYDFVGLDNRAAALEATRHLLENGYRDLALLVEPRFGVSTRIERTSAALDEIARWPEARGHLFEIQSWDETTVDRALSDFMGREGAGHKAILAASGIVTLRTVQAMARLHLTMPEIGLVGFDDLEWSHLVGPGITTVQQPTNEIGAMLIQHLVARIEEDPSPRRDTIFPARLIIRGSSCRR